ncbi:MAG: formamidopyrimidine-DNA glycosylase [Myxococcota bacterium]|jgi:formamidopyrimidine-DNA glycosylase
MPEYPDVVVYQERLVAHLEGRVITGVRLGSPFVLRTFDPKISAVAGSTVHGVKRLGKRLILELDDDLFLVVHLMVAGRLRWKRAGIKQTGRNILAVFDIEDAADRPSGCLVFTEASKKKRASIHMVRGIAALEPFDRCGLDVFTSSPAAFAARFRSERHTLKRTLTDPRLFDGIGNAYSDEILHRAQLSPVQMSTNLDDETLARLQLACREVLTEWAERLRAEVGEGFPDKVTAFRSEMAVHGKYNEPCPVCATPVQRIVKAENEVNYCPTCQTGGRLLADRALSRLLKGDWPKSLAELDDRLGR